MSENVKKKSIKTLGDILRAKKIAEAKKAKADEAKANTKK